MAIDIKTVPFGETLEGGTRNGVYKKKEFHGRGMKIVNMGELFGHPRLFSVPMKRVELTEKEQSKSSLKQGDLLFARRSLVAEGAGKCSIVMEVNEPTTFESSIIRARPDPTIANSLFMYYLFNSPLGLYLLGTIRRQVAVAGITGTDLVKLEVPLPKIGIQHVIAHILGSLDDKIELNRQMNRTLEKMAQTIFKSWFIDFDPVRAKAEGRDPALPKDIADLFPNSFEDSELGEIPTGWEVKPIGNAVQCVGGATPSTKKAEFWDGGTNPFLTPKDMSSLNSPIILDTDRHITDEGVEKISSKRIPAGTVILSSRAPIGYLAINEVPVSVNQGIIAMICNGDLPNHYVLLWTMTNMETIKSKAGGTTFAEISKKNFRPIPALIPATNMLDAFTKQVEPLFQQVVENVVSVESLARARDTLLPKLISGELPIPDAEKLLEGIE